MATCKDSDTKVKEDSQRMITVMGVAYLGYEETRVFIWGPWQERPFEALFVS